MAFHFFFGPFRLFRAPLETARGYRASGECSLCRGRAAPVFELGIGADVIVPCGACSAEVALDADDREEVACARCGGPVAFPLTGRDRLLVCGPCLTAGKAAITQDTELGMVRWVDAHAGLTQGLPVAPPAGWETTPPDDEGWMRVRVPREHLLELVRTPGYPTIQGERWLFCCGCPMNFVGQWSRETFDQEAEDGDGKRLFERIVEDQTPRLWEDGLHDETGIYVFECGGCQRRRAHWDVA